MSSGDEGNDAGATPERAPESGWRWIAYVMFFAGTPAMLWQPMVAAGAFVAAGLLAIAAAIEERERWR